MSLQEKRFYFVSIVRQTPDSNELNHMNVVLDVHPAEYIMYSKKHLDPVGAADHIKFYSEIEEQEFNLLKDAMYIDITKEE